MRGSTLPLLVILACCSACGGESATENRGEPAARDESNMASGGHGASELGDPAYGWAYVASGERGGPEAVYGVVQGESFLALTCDRGRRVLKVTALGLPERLPGRREAIRVGDVRDEFAVRWTAVDYGGDNYWDRLSEIPLDHPLAAALAVHQGPIVFEQTADGVPAEIPTDAAVRRVVGECRSD